MTKISKFTTATVLGGALVAGIAAASAEPAAGPSTSSDKRMMGGMMQGGGMMPMMHEMSRMMDNCDRMMQAMTDRQNQGGSGQQNPDKRG